MRIAAFWCAVAYTALVAPASAQTQCATIPDDSARLQCYDAANKPTSTPEENVPEKSPAGRASYAIALKRALLGIGLDFDVFAMEQRDPKQAINSPAKYFPQLIVFGPLNNPLVYQMAGEGAVLKRAKAAGYNSVEFSSKGGGGRWLWDISALAAPPCDIAKRVCL